MNSLWIRYGLFGLLSALAVGLDQWTKRLAVENLMGNGPFVIWVGVFELLYSENRGAAFRFLQGKHAFLFLLPAAVIGVVLLIRYRMPWSRRYMPLYFSMVLLTSGAVGYMIDRAVQGYVVDFLYFSLIDFPIFNVADCYVVTAAVLLVLLTGFYYKEGELDFFSGKEKAR